MSNEGADQEKCNNCLCNLWKCQAECCKEFTINMIPHRVYTKGSLISIDLSDADMVNYMLLHGAYFCNGKLLFKLENFKKIGNKIKVFQRCKALTDDNLCSLHNKEEQPFVCRDIRKNGAYITKNCIFRRE